MSTPNSYLKYLVIALIIAVSAQGLTIYLLQKVEIMGAQIHDLDKDVLVVKERLRYLGMLSRNTQLYDQNSTMSAGPPGY